MVRNKRQKRKPVSEINVVPYIDVMMVLLIVFMITAPMLTQGVKVDLPQVNTDPLPQTQQNQMLVVSIKADGRYFLDLGDSQRQQTALSQDEVASQVGKLTATNAKLDVLINGDRQVPYGKVVELMGTLQGAGVPNVGLITEPETMQ